MNQWHLYLTAMLLLGIAQSNTAESRVALVSGNAAYPDTPLKSPLKDARVISKTPRGLGFACRNKPFQRRFRRASRGLVALDAERGTRIAYGAAPATAACDGYGKSGIYTGAQLRALRGPVLTAGAVFKQVRTRVSKLTRNRRMPLKSSSSNDRFVFNPTVHMTAPAPTAATGAGESTVEPGFWQSAEQANAAGPYQAYLDKYSQGDFVPLARIRVQKLKPVEETLTLVSGRSGIRRFELSPAAQVASGAAPPVPASRLAPEMVVISAGRFLMGSPKSEVGRHDSEGPQHQVTLARPFRIGKYEVSVAEYSQFVEATMYRTEAEREGGCYHWDGEWKKDSGRTWRSPGFSQAATHPVVCVSWNDALVYAEWLTRVTGGRRYRLPTEAEWEYVARGGTTGARYWGKNLSDACEYANVHDQTSKRVNGFGWTHHDCDDGRAQTAPVGSYRANGFGLHDVLGNVLEWTGDCWNDSYRGAPSDGSAQESGSCARRVLRGGSWDNIPRVVRAANRGSNPRYYRDIHLGFRLAQDM